MKNDKSVMSVRQAAELDHALRRNGCDAGFVKWLSTGGVLAQVLKVKNCTHRISPIPMIVDMDADPYIPDGWSVPEGWHKKQGRFKFDPTKLRLYLDDNQKKGKWTEGKNLEVELQGQSTMNANLLDWLLEHPRLIPEEWKGKRVYFWATIYRDSEDCCYVRCLYWDDGWHWGHDWVGGAFRGDYPAVVRAS